MYIYREPLEPGLKLTATLRHLAAGSAYSDRKFSWRVPHITLSVVVRKVCRANTQEVLFFFIGDDAYALRTTMMKPYSPHRILKKNASRITGSLEPSVW